MCGSLCLLMGSMCGSLYDFVLDGGLEIFEVCAVPGDTNYESRMSGWITFGFSEHVFVEYVCLYLHAAQMEVSAEQTRQGQSSVFALYAALVEFEVESAAVSPFVAVKRGGRQ